VDDGDDRPPVTYITGEYWIASLACRPCDLDWEAEGTALPDGREFAAFDDEGQCPSCNEPGDLTGVRPG
jgi:hypothetical protein